jgi:hypothetical protein
MHRECPRFKYQGADAGGVIYSPVEGGPSGHYQRPDGERLLAIAPGVRDTPEMPLVIEASILQADSGFFPSAIRILPEAGVVPSPAAAGAVLPHSNAQPESLS